MKKVNWSRAFLPLIRKYKKRTHPLKHKNLYQLLVSVVLSAQTTDDLINDLTPKLFARYPGFKELSVAKAEELFPYLSKVRSYVKKSNWLVAIAKEFQSREIPLTIEALTELPGIGRKSANVIISEMGREMEGVVVDLHVARVALRLGIAREEKPEKIEKSLMEVVPREDWKHLGLALTYLGRETCRPTDPYCSTCVMKQTCAYYQGLKP